MASSELMGPSPTLRLVSLVVTTVIALTAVVAVLALLRRGQPVPDTSSVLVTRVIDGDTSTPSAATTHNADCGFGSSASTPRNGLATAGPRTAWPTKQPCGSPR
jgi:hypothetical protein